MTLNNPPAALCLVGTCVWVSDLVCEKGRRGRGYFIRLTSKTFHQIDVVSEGMFGDGLRSELVWVNIAVCTVWPGCVRRFWDL